MSNKVPQHVLDKAVKREKFADNFLSVVALITALIVGGLAAWGAWSLLALLLPFPELFWSVIGIVVMGSAWALGLWLYGTNHDIVENAKRFGVIDE